MDLNVKTNMSRSSMFDSMSQIMNGTDPTTLRPMFDRLLVRDVPDAELSPGGIVLTAAPSLGGLGKTGRIRIGEVIACGKGDPWFNWMEKGKVKIHSYPCPRCGGGFMRGGTSWLAKQAEESGDYLRPWCPRCEGRGHSHVDLIVKPGDRIVYDRRKEAEIFIDGERFTLCHEQQAVYGRMVVRMVNIPPEQRKTRMEVLAGCCTREEFEPIYDRITVEPLEPEQSGLIARPGTAKQEPLRQGIVRAVGQGSREMDGKIHPLSVKPGDRVLYRAEGGGGAARAEDIQLFGEGLLIMREKLIWAIL